MELPEMIAGEAEDAMKYAKCALAHKEDHPDLAETFIQLSAEELGHMERLYNQAVSMIKNMHNQYKNM